MTKERLVEILESGVIKTDPFIARTWGVEKAADLILSELAKEKPEEPLAVLAERKGLWMNINHHNNVWAIHFGVKDNVRDPFPTERCLEENSYPAAEREARSWLMAQPDRNEKEGK